MRDKRLPPLPERDKRRTLEYLRNRPFGSVTIQRNPHVLTAVPVGSIDAPVEDLHKNTRDSPDCESHSTVAPSPVGDPTQGRVRFEIDDVCQDRQEPRRLPPRNDPRRREANMGATPLEPEALTAGTRADNSSLPDEEGPRMAPLVEEPLRNDDGCACLLTWSHYIVSGSVGPHPSAMRPFHMAFDTGSVYNVIRLRDLPRGWEQYRIPDAPVPPLGDANGNRLRLLGKVSLRVRFGPSMYRVAFLVAERLAVSVIIGNSFMNRRVRGIMCMDGDIWLMRAKIPIILRYPRRTPGAEHSLESRKVTEDPPLNRERDNVNLLHTVKLRKFVTIPAKSQLAVHVWNEASGLFFIEPKHPVLARHIMSNFINVRTASGVAELKGNRPFTIVVSNFSDQPRMLPTNE